MRWGSIFIAIAVLACAYTIGYLNGTRSAVAGAQLLAEDAVLPAASTPQQTLPNDNLPPAFAQALAARDWDALVQLLEDANLAGEDSTYAAMHKRLLQVAHEMAEQDAVVEGTELLRTFIDLNPHDEEALFALAALYADAQQFALALEPIFQVLDFPRTTELAAQAAARRDEYVRGEAELLAEQSLDERIAFYQYLTGREPTNDQHRLALAAVLVEADELDAAGSVLAAVGGFGVEAEDVVRVRQQLQLAAAGLPIERQGEALYAQIQVNGETLRLLVDTGASKTAIDASALAALDVQPANRVARLLTAGGPIRADVYMVSQLRFGGLELDNFEVVGLESVPAQTQGLLGMDLLNQVGELSIQ